MALTHPLATRNAIAETIRTLTEAGFAPVIELYDGAVLLAELAMDPTTPWVAASGGEINATFPLSDVSANASGTCDNFIIYDDPSGGGGTEVLRGLVTATGGGGDLEFSNDTFVAGETINITTFTWAAPV